MEAEQSPQGLAGFRNILSSYPTGQDNLQVQHAAAPSPKIIDYAVVAHGPASAVGLWRAQHIFRESAPQIGVGTEPPASASALIPKVRTRKILLPSPLLPRSWRDWGLFSHALCARNARRFPKRNPPCYNAGPALGSPHTMQLA